MQQNAHHNQWEPFDNQDKLEADEIWTNPSLVCQGLFLTDCLG